MTTREWIEIAWGGTLIACAGLFLTLLLLADVPMSTPAFHYASGQEMMITFRLYGTHMEDTVGQVLAAVGWNMTVFEPLQNRTILVEAIPLT